MNLEPSENHAIIGVLGGMGPAATADFYAKIVGAAPALRDQDHPRTLIWSDPTIPDRTNALIATGPHPGHQLTDGARRLEGSGADIIAVPCNTAHAFLPEIRAAVSIPVLDMVEETLDAIVLERSAENDGSAEKTRVHAVGLLATNGTVRARLYEQATRRHGLELLLPEPQLQETVMSAIRMTKADSGSAEAAEALTKAVAELAAMGAEQVIAACTEIPIALQHANEPTVPIVDPAAILAVSAVRWASAHRAGELRYHLADGSDRWEGSVA